MRILNVTYDDLRNPWLAGGGAVRGHEINRRLAGAHEISVLTGNYPGARDETVDGVLYRRVGAAGPYWYSRMTFTAGLPGVLRASTCDLLVNEFSPFAPCLVSSSPGRPVVHVFHHILGRHALRKYPIVGLVPHIFERVCFSRARNAVAVSPGIQRALQRYLSPSCRTWCLPSGVERALFDMDPQDGGYLLFLGRMDVYMKGLDLLLESFAGIRQKYEIPLKIAGRGTERSRRRLRRQAAAWNLGGDVEFLGAVDEARKRDLLAGATVVCLPSRFEGWGLTAVEAAAAGKAVVGTDIPGLRDAVIHEVTGLLTPPENPQAFTEAVVRLLDDPVLRADLGRQGRERAKRFQWDRVAEDWEDILLTIMGSAASPAAEQAPRGQRG